MGWNDRMDDDDGYSDFLQEIIDAKCLDQAAVGITRLVIDKREGVLSDKQKYVFNKHVLNAYVTEECTRCQNEIPWCEMLEAHDNGGYCSWCVKMMSNDD